MTTSQARVMLLLEAVMVNCSTGVLRAMTGTSNFTTSWAACLSCSVPHMVVFELRMIVQLVALGTENREYLPALTG